MATFLLGLPTSGSFNIDPQTQYNNWYFVGFAQDDWRATPSLTLNAGSRFESESSINESNDRAVWCDQALTNEVTGPAATAYAKATIPELPTSSFNAAGGMQFATSGGRRVEYFTPTLYVSPRVGLAFTPGLFKTDLLCMLAMVSTSALITTITRPRTYNFFQPSPTSPPRITI